MSYKLALLLVQNFHGMSLSLPALLLGCVINPEIDYGHGRKFLEKWVIRETQNG